MRLESFLDNYITAATQIRITCKQDAEIFFEGYKGELANYPEMEKIALDLWIYDIHADDDILVIVISY